VEYLLFVAGHTKREKETLSKIKRERERKK
jgi:hypothetical protein